MICEKPSTSSIITATISANSEAAQPSSLRAKHSTSTGAETDPLPGKSRAFAWHADADADADAKCEQS